LVNLRYDRRGSVFAVAAVFFALIFFAVLWFFMYSEDGFVTRVVEATEPIHETLNTTSHELYASSVEFMDAIMAWILIFVLFGLFIAGIVYTHRKRGEDYY
jgi:cbb3-type cytochrome oxidase subunit 3